MGSPRRHVPVRDSRRPAPPHHLESDPTRSGAARADGTGLTAAETNHIDLDAVGCSRVLRTARGTSATRAAPQPVLDVAGFSPVFMTGCARVRQSWHSYGPCVPVGSTSEIGFEPWHS